MSTTARILVVDDNRSVVRLLELTLQLAGYEVLTAYDGPEGYSKACGETPDLIILDVMMPGMDGYEVCRALQKRDATARIPIVFLTEKGQVNGATDPTKKRAFNLRVRERITGFDAGATEFLSKPIVAKDVIEKVRVILEFTQPISDD